MQCRYTEIAQRIFKYSGLAYNTGTPVLLWIKKTKQFVLC